MSVEKLPAPELPNWLAALVPFERYCIDVGGYRMHVMETGEGRPVLMLHGNPTWGFLYRKVAQELLDEPLRLIMPDLLGLGLSQRPRSDEHSLESHGRWVGRLIDALELDGIIGMGQDWGGPLLFLPFAERRQRVAGLVILNTVIGPPRRGFKPTAFHRFSRLPLLSDFAFRALGLPQRLLHLAQGDRSSIRGDVARAYRYPLRIGAGNAGPLALARVVPNNFEHPSIEPLQRSQAFLEAFDGPIAIVWGDRDPILGSVGRWVERVLPNAVMTHTDAGHFLQEEVPDVIADAVRHVVGQL